jgi:hypothetical protein
MNKEIPKPVIIAAIALAVVAVIALGMFVMKSGGGELSDKTFKPVPFNPPGGFKPGGPHGATAPSGTEAQKSAETAGK